VKYGGTQDRDARFDLLELTPPPPPHNCYLGGRGMFLVMSPTRAFSVTRLSLHLVPGFQVLFMIGMSAP
jgi:hypothetical protein